MRVNTVKKSWDGYYKNVTTRYQKQPSVWSIGKHENGENNVLICMYLQIKNHSKTDITVSVYTSNLNVRVVVADNKPHRSTKSAIEIDEQACEEMQPTACTTVYFIWK